MSSFKHTPMIHRTLDIRSILSVSKALTLVLLCSILTHSSALPVQRDISQINDRFSHLKNLLQRSSDSNNALIQVGSDTEHDNSYVKRLRRQSSAGEIQCDDASLEMIRESCELTVTPSRITNATEALSNEIRSSFCSRNCRTLVYQYDQACGFDELILNVSGVCTRGAEIQCLSAIIISKPGIFSCLRPTVDYGVLSDREDIESSAFASSDGMHCTIQSSFATFVPYRLEPGESGNIVISPPLTPPWGSQCVQYPDKLGHSVTTTELPTTQTTTEPTTTEIVMTTTAISTSSESNTTTLDIHNIVTTRKSGGTTNHCSSDINILVMVGVYLLLSVSNVL